MADHREMDEYGRPSVASRPGEDIEKQDKISSDDEHRKIDLDPYRNESFHNSKEAQEYERKKANALLANPLRGYSEAELRAMGKNYALGKQACGSCRTWHGS
jgi:hypothetical protein